MEVLPITPVQSLNRLGVIASKAFSKLKEGGILIHCEGGRGRTGTIIGAILRHCGYGAAEVINFLDAAYRAAGKLKGWPESPWQSQVVERIKPIGSASSPRT
jgi:protein-tyrosine phosphatase